MVAVEGSVLHYVAVGAGEPVVFLHGNPTSSHLWRRVLEPVAQAGGRRCLAVDLIGMGRSGKPDIGYRLADHVRYLDAFLERTAPDGVTLVGHDWGGVIALDHARRHPARVRGVAVLESHLRPIPTWDDLDDGGRQLFGGLRTPGVGERMVFEDNVFVEAILQAGTLRRLTAEDLDAYRAPFTDPATRLPMLAWAREIPIAGEPADVVEVVEANREVIRDPGMPVLLLHATPGAVVDAAAVARSRAEGRNLTVADVGAGLHFLPEDRPAEIAAHLTTWLGGVR
jgi:haloalkane dehalogenase